MVSLMCIESPIPRESADTVGMIINVAPWHIDRRRDLIKSVVESAMTVEIRGKVVFRNSALAAGVMTNGNRGAPTGLRWRSNSNDDSGMVQRRRRPDVIHPYLRDIRDRRARVHENRDTVSKS